MISLLLKPGLGKKLTPQAAAEICVSALGDWCRCFGCLGRDESWISLYVFIIRMVLSLKCVVTCKIAAHYAYAHKWVNKQYVSVRTAVGVRHCAFSPGDIISRQLR